MCTYRVGLTQGIDLEVSYGKQQVAFFRLLDLLVHRETSPL